ncbi:hypothetical protein ACWGKQ_36400 [Streptomyces sp. NPDC054770]
MTAQVFRPEEERERDEEELTGRTGRQRSAVAATLGTDIGATHVRPLAVRPVSQSTLDDYDYRVGVAPIGWSS